MRRSVKWILAGLSLSAVLIGGCKRQQDKASPQGVHLPALIGPPSTQEQEDSQRAKLLANFYDLPALGNGTVFVDDAGESWVRQSNGLMIHDILPSNDDQPPRLGQSVTIAYKGNFPGSKTYFDQAPRDKPLTFRLGSKDIIQGLSLGLQGMHVGGTRRIYIPGELAYGEKGDPKGVIPPNQPLIFEVQLLAITGTALKYTLSDLPKFEPLGPPAPGALPATGPGTRPAREPTGQK